MASLVSRLWARVRAGDLRHAIKTGVAAVVCLYVTDLFRLPQGYWAAVSAMIVLQSSVGATVNASLNRLAGTAIGAGLGGLLVALWGSHVWSLGAAATLTVWSCSALGLRDSFRLASATVALVMLTGHAGSPGTVALHRFLEVAVGILVALLVTLLMWPSRARDDLQRAMVETLRRLAALYEAVVQRYGAGAAPALDEVAGQVTAAFRRHDELLKQAAYEPGAAQLDHERLTAITAHLARTWQALEALELATRGSQHDTYHHCFEPELGRLLSEISAAFDRLAETLAVPRATCAPTVLERAMAAADAKVTAVRTSGVSIHYNLEEVARFYAFFISVKGLVQALTWADDRQLPDAP